jgi:hypothetical protein
MVRYPTVGVDIPVSSAGRPLGSGIDGYHITWPPVPGWALNENLAPISDATVRPSSCSSYPYILS